MSITLMSKVWTLDLGAHEEGRSRKLVLMALADHANDEGYCYPSAAYIGWKTEYSERQIQRILDDLEAEKLIAVAKEYSPTTPRVYKLTLENAKVKPEYQRKPAGRGDIYSSRQTGGVTSNNARGDIQRGRGDILPPRGDIAKSPEPSLEPSLEPPENPRASGQIEFSFPPSPAHKKQDPEFGIAYSAYCESFGELQFTNIEKFGAIWDDYPLPEVHAHARDAMKNSADHYSLRFYEEAVKAFAFKHYERGPGGAWTKRPIGEAAPARNGAVKGKLALIREALYGHDGNDLANARDVTPHLPAVTGGGGEPAEAPDHLARGPGGRAR